MELLQIKLYLDCYLVNLNDKNHKVELLALIYELYFLSYPNPNIV